MEKDLIKLKEMFLNREDIDQDDIDQINEWENALRDNKDFEAWQNHGITQSIVKQLKDFYRDTVYYLGTVESISEVDRIKLWSKQDAIKFILSYMTKDVKGEFKQISDEIKKAIEINNN